MTVDKYEVTVAGYTMDIAPILNVLIAFVENVLKAYLPTELQDVLASEEDA